MKFWLFRIRVSVYGSWRFRSLGAWGFCDDELDRVAFDDGDTVRDYFVEAWCRE